MIEKPAKDVSGRFLYDSRTNKYWFRVYGGIDSVTNRKTYTDYSLWAEDIEVTINATGLSLYDGVDSDSNNNKNRLDWSSDVLKSIFFRK